MSFTTKARRLLAGLAALSLGAVAVTSFLPPALELLSPSTK